MKEYGSEESPKFVMVLYLVEDPAHVLYEYPSVVDFLEFTLLENAVYALFDYVYHCLEN